MRKASRKPPHTQITHDLLEALARTPLPGRHFRIMMALLRLLDGWHRTANQIGADELSTRTGIHVSDIRRCLKDLIAWGVIRRSGGDRGRGRAAVIEIIRDFDLWKITATSESQRRADGRDKTGRVPPVSEEGKESGNRDDTSKTGGQKRGEGTLFSENGVTEENGVTTRRKRGDKGAENRGEPPPTKDSKDSKDSVGPAAPASPSLEDQDFRRLRNFIAKLEGDEAEQLAWLESGIGLEILGAADAELPDDPTSKQRSGKLAQITSARWRTYLKGDRPFQGPAAIRRLEAQRARDAPRRPAAEDMTPEEFQDFMAQPTIAGMFDHD